MQKTKERDRETHPLAHRVGLALLGVARLLVVVLKVLAAIAMVLRVLVERERDLHRRHLAHRLGHAPVEAVSARVAERGHVDEGEVADVGLAQERQERREKPRPLALVRRERVEAVQGEAVERVLVDVLREEEA